MALSFAFYGLEVTEQALGGIPLHVGLADDEPLNYHNTCNVKHTNTFPCICLHAFLTCFSSLLAGRVG